MPIVDALGGGQGSVWAPRLVCGSAAPYATNSDALCVLFFYQNQHECLQQFEQNLICWIGPNGPAFAPHVHQWALSHDPVASSPLILPWTTFDRYWQLQAGNTPQELQFWRCSDPVIYPSQFGPWGTHSNPYACPFFLLLTHQLWG